MGETRSGLLALTIATGGPGCCADLVGNHALVGLDQARQGLDVVRPLDRAGDLLDQWGHALHRISLAARLRKVLFPADHLQVVIHDRPRFADHPLPALDIRQRQLIGV